MKILTNIEINKWSDFRYEIKNGVITWRIIVRALRAFWLYLSNSDFDKINSTLLVQMKAQNELGQYRSISTLQILKFYNFPMLRRIFIEYWGLKNQTYLSGKYKYIIFTYKIINSDIPEKITTVEDDLFIEKEKESTTKYSFGFELPNTMDITTWGDYHMNESCKEAIVYKKYSHAEYHVKLEDQSTTVDIKVGDRKLITFIDTMKDPQDLSTFTRTINNQTYYFCRGELLLKKIEKEVHFLSNKTPDNHNFLKIITMDLETRLIDGVMTPYCVSIYDGSKSTSFYLT